ncbi:sulfoxide reductase heme-binding subunit YedZ [Phyllobacterium sp. BT25]|uniref:Protein-methionine-sulfoxide reductase heme-binding subunit MsrQ n=1 Tax=Phyllobacterium pellucidum TaxID=2740464 RepID=A0A849VJV6_9HYPH|nr:MULTISPECIES: protein-methionine-sulfoxide reductase heme-binding subunit MsrQ [Phyllobacterium]NTS30138.1 sulfoxide reductase heme-binding subunit YedZ [Phyllobacterium pellucidum]UGY11125.1 sulfoxide reductase heme-binding subunit YedZ [Phyllobacterium sp. T1018]
MTQTKRQNRIAMKYPWNDRAGKPSVIKIAALAVAFLPLLWIAASYKTNILGPRPITQAIHETGDWAIRFFLVSLTISPLRAITRWSKLILVRRILGLTALAYALLHFSLYIVDQNFNLSRVATEIWLRIYLLIGFVTLLGLVALGVTSTDAMIRRMGKNWNRLHRLAYPLAALGILHFFMQSKADVTEPTLMAGLLLALLAYRVAKVWDFDIAAVPTLIAIAVIAAFGTVLIEYAWFAVATRIPPSRVLLANLSFSHSIRPTWWVLMACLIPAFWAAIRPMIGNDGRKINPLSAK